MTYRRFPSRWGWRRPGHPYWNGFTIGVRVAVIAAVAWAVIAR